MLSAAGPPVRLSAPSELISVTLVEVPVRPAALIDTEIVLVVEKVTVVFAVLTIAAGTTITWAPLVLTSTAV